MVERRGFLFVRFKGVCFNSIKPCGQCMNLFGGILEEDEGGAEEDVCHS